MPDPESESAFATPATLRYTLASMPHRFAVLALLAAAFFALLLFGGSTGSRVPPYPAPPLSANPQRWLNTEPIRPGHDRIALIEIWSYG
jgi:hypothetical protein